MPISRGNSLAFSHIFLYFSLTLSKFSFFFSSNKRFGVAYIRLSETAMDQTAIFITLKHYIALCNLCVQPQQYVATFRCRTSAAVYIPKLGNCWQKKKKNISNMLDGGTSHHSAWLTGAKVYKSGKLRLNLSKFCKSYKPRDTGNWRPQINCLEHT